MKQIGINAAPIVLGLILGSIAEVGYVQALRGGATLLHPAIRLFVNPLSWFLIVMVLFSVAWPLISALLRRRRRGKQGAQ